MQANTAKAPAAIRVDLPQYLSRYTVSFKMARDFAFARWGERMSRHLVSAATFRVCSILRRAAAKGGSADRQSFWVISIQEAGLDGFWIHRVLEREGVESYVVDPASIATSRRRRLTGKHWLERCWPTTAASVGFARCCECQRRGGRPSSVVRERKALTDEPIRHLNWICAFAIAGCSSCEPARARRWCSTRMTVRSPSSAGRAHAASTII